jgi:hypothetical protein
MQKLSATIVFLCLAIGLLSVQAQENTSESWSVAGNYHRGFLIAHRPMVVSLQKNHLNGLEFSILKTTSGAKAWQSQYNNPEIGVSLSGWNSGNKEQLGNAYAMIPYINFPLIKNNNHQFAIKFGWGIGYVEKIFDAEDNYKNIVIGSHLNCALQFQPNYSLNIGEKITATGGLNVTHFSNGSSSTPNLGINFASVTAGVRYRFAKTAIASTAPTPEFTRSSRITTFAAASFKETYPAEGNKYAAFTLSGSRFHQTSSKIGLGYGIDLFYDGSAVKKQEQKGGEASDDLDYFKSGIHAGCELAIADITILLNMGGYLFNRVTGDGTFYHRFGIRYQAGNNIFVCMNLKSHWAKADFIEWGIGYRINRTTKK